MATCDRIRVSVIDGYYLSLRETGLPLPVCIQLQECKLSLSNAQWTAKQTSSGFSVSLFWPVEQQSTRISKKRRKRSKRRLVKTTLPSFPSTSNSVELSGPTATETAEAKSPAPIGAHPPDAKPTTLTQSTGSILVADPDHVDSDACPDLLACDSVRYEVQNGQPGVRCTRDDDDEWVPVVKKKRRKRREPESESVSDDSGDELRVRFAREVRYQVKDGTPGLRIRRGNTMHSWRWTPIAPSPIATRTRSRIS